MVVETLDRMTVSQSKWGMDRFLATRREVLAQWPSGQDAENLEESIARRRELPIHKNAVEVFRLARVEDRVLLQPRYGVALLEEQIKSLSYMQEVGGADILPTQTDAYTRHLRYDQAANGLRESETAGRSLLCGFPVLAHGLHQTRKIVESLDRPCSTRQASAHGLLTMEMYLAAGFSYVLMGPLQNLSYEKDISAEQLIANIQYQDRLIGLYEEGGAPVMKEMTATLTGTLVPPCIAVAVSILDGLLAVEQGVRHLVLSYGQYGNLEQDVAAIRIMRELGNEYLTSRGHGDCEVYTVASQWMGDFPHDESHAMGLISWGTATAALAGVSQVMVKSSDEGFGVPSKESNAEALKASRHVLRLIGKQRLEEGPTLRREMETLRREVRAIIDRTLELGDGDVAVGIVNALAAGVIDVPFSPTKLNAGRALPIRDVKGAIRFLDPGNIPLPPDILEFHRDAVTERQAAEREKAGYQLVIDDIYSVR